MTEESRDNVINVLVGGRKEGKSSTVADYIIPAALAQGKAVFLCQPKWNPAYIKYEADTRIKFLVTGDIDEIMKLVKNVYNACVIIEEEYVYFDDSLPKEVKVMIINTGQQNVDMHFIGHNYTWVCKDLYRIANVFTIMRCGESPRARQGNTGFTADEVLFIEKGLKDLPKYKHFILQRT